MNKTSISYADLTWNPMLGCSRASEAHIFVLCKHMDPFGARAVPTTARRESLTDERTFR